MTVELRWTMRVERSGISKAPSRRRIRCAGVGWRRGGLRIGWLRRSTWSARRASHRQDPARSVWRQIIGEPNRSRPCRGRWNGHARVCRKRQCASAGVEHRHGLAPNDESIAQPASRRRGVPLPSRARIDDGRRRSRRKGAVMRHSSRKPMTSGDPPVRSVARCRCPANSDPADGRQRPGEISRKRRDRPACHGA